MTLKNGAEVTLESGSINVIDDGLTINGATLNIVLNDKNKYDDTTATVFADGATQLTVNNVNAITNNGAMKFVIDGAIQDTYYLGAIGNFTGQDGMIISQVNSGTGLASVVTDKLGSGIWLEIAEGYFLATRFSSSSAKQNESNTFNNVFAADGTGATFAAGDWAVLIGDINATGEVSVGTGITDFSVTSNSANDVRTITATNGNRFFNVNGNTVITLDNVAFDGGNAGPNNHGGAILSDDGSTLTLNSTGKAIMFQNNSAVNGGAIEAGTVHINGTFTFDGNTTSLNDAGNGGEGGAIDAWDVTISGKNTFSNNKAVNGGAIWAQNLTFEGTDSIATFSGNTASGSGNDVYIAKNSGAPGSLTFKDDGTYGLLSGVYVDGTTEMNDSVKVTFGQFSKNTLNGAMTFNDTASILFSAFSKSALNGNLTINDSASVLFGYSSDTTISGMTTMNAQQVNTFANGATLKFNGGLTLGDGVEQGFSGADVTLGGALGITYGGDPNALNSQANFSGANSLTVADGTRLVIYDVDGNTLTAKDFAGKVLGSSVLAIDNSDNELEKIVPDDFSYESLLYSVNMVYENECIALNSEKKKVDPVPFAGNTASAVALFGEKTIYDVQTERQVREKVNAASNETVADAGQAIINKVNYFNRALVGRMMGTAEMYSETPSDVFRGQSGSCNSPRIPSVWISGYGLDSGAAQYGGYSPYSYRSGGTLLGMEWQNNVSRIGWWFGYGESKTDSYSTHLTGKEYSFGLNGRFENECGYTALIGGFGFNSFDGSHLTSTGAGEGLDFDSWNATIYAERGLSYHNVLGLNVNPYAAVQYISYRGDGFQTTEMSLEQTELDSLQTILGLRFAKAFNMNGYIGTMDAGIAWHHEFLDEAGFQATVGNNSAMIYGNMAGRDFVEFTAGLGVDINARVNISGNYYLYFNRYSTMNAGMGTVTVRF